jgi:hypothetical protein
MSVNINWTPMFKIHEVSNIPIKTVTIFLTNNDEYVGHISANIYSNNTAGLSMSGIRTIPLPSNLDTIRNYILEVKHQDVALLVDEKYRKKGKSKELICLMLDYLIKEGIDDIIVNGISDEIAMKTYISTGVIKTGDNTAIYNNIKNVFNYESQFKTR